ncbi:TonB-dependent receptor domain-containing protein [Biformimicrobium ophioploci]|uniref:MipA/OmpV family protein n=1 Tax=Biformimicrobium ophioploci TaxID=3036711 RepID=A0ABQ6LVV4_9GAMM|nr:TonB-dependent receptor [Microbulbifer sp. NKW57]GMG86234.1 hypothetical protein MNKW57_05550 [Microbulbifer sp. NKW57]
MAVCLFGAAGVALADAPRSEWQLSLAAGTGNIENPLNGWSEQAVSVLPSVRFRRDRFFIENLNLGYTLKEGHDFYVDLLLRPNEDGFYYQFESAHEEVSSFGLLPGRGPGSAVLDATSMERDLSFLFGPSATFITRLADISFGYFQDVSEVHYGSETHLSFSKSHRLFGGAVGWKFGAVQKSTGLVEYYYHPMGEEAAVLHFALSREFPADKVLDQYFNLHLEYPLTKRLSATAVARYDKFDLDGRNPEIMGVGSAFSWFAGLRYAIGSGR